MSNFLTGLFTKAATALHLSSADAASVASDAGTLTAVLTTVPEQVQTVVAEAGTLGGKIEAFVKPGEALVTDLIELLKNPGAKAVENLADDVITLFGTHGVQAAQASAESSTSSSTAG